MLSAENAALRPGSRCPDRPAGPRGVPCRPGTPPSAPTATPAFGRRKRPFCRVDRRRKNRFSLEMAGCRRRERDRLRRSEVSKGQSLLSDVARPDLEDTYSIWLHVTKNTDPRISGSKDFSISASICLLLCGTSHRRLMQVY